jgi:hypothetical protein
MVKRLPKKVEGAEFSYEGHHLTCKPTGREFNGVPALAWFHDNGEQAFRSVNGAITFIEPSENSENQTHELPTVDDVIVKKYEGKVVEEEYLYQLAWNIAKRRFPSMNDKTDTFGMIVNSIKTALYSI